MANLTLKIAIAGQKHDDLLAVVPPRRYYKALALIKARATLAARDAAWAMIPEMATWSEAEWHERCGDE